MEYQNKLPDYTVRLEAENSCTNIKPERRTRCIVSKDKKFTCISCGQRWKIIKLLRDKFVAWRV